MVSRSRTPSQAATTKEPTALPQAFVRARPGRGRGGAVGVISTLIVEDDPVLAEAHRALHESVGQPLPKGLADATLRAVFALLRAEGRLSAAQTATGVGVPVQTARRYLDYLTAQRLVSRAPVYGGAGRPEQVYRWTSS